MDKLVNPVIWYAAPLGIYFRMQDFGDHEAWHPSDKMGEHAYFVTDDYGQLVSIARPLKIGVIPKEYTHRVQINDRVYLNVYTCHFSLCRRKWHDTWDSVMLGKCPRCGSKNNTPEDVIDVTAEYEDIIANEDKMYRNHYQCYNPLCKDGWSSDWSSKCDDTCPECGSKNNTPIRSDDVTEDYRRIITLVD